MKSPGGRASPPDATGHCPAGAARGTRKYLVPAEAPLLTRLSIQGLAIIDRLSIEFSPGFNVITGETGAGKSILIRALNYLLGGRASADVIRQGATEAIITGEFVIPKRHPAVDALEKIGIPRELTDGSCHVLLRRLISARGRSQSWVNDVSVTSQPLRELGVELIDVFAQHENQRLLEPSRHVTYLDECTGTAELRAVVSAAADACGESIDEMERVLSEFIAGEKNRDFLEFRLEELRRFNPLPEDYDQVHALCTAADSVGRVREALVGALGALEGGGEYGPAQRIWEAAKRLERLSADGVAGREANQPNSDGQKSLGAFSERARQIATELDDLVFELRTVLGRYEFDETGLENAQSRLFGYQSLFRKHGVKEIGELVDALGRLEADMERLGRAAERLTDGMNELEKRVAALERASAALTEARGKSAKVIAKAVEKELQELAMPGAKFGVEFQPVERSVAPLDLSPFDPALAERWQGLAARLGKQGPSGAERAQFLLAANPGEPILPLTRIASGGELSRVMLALKKSLSVEADTCVLVFDEIDTGISGRVADVVGRKMRELADGFQVICISHLPQVAVYADKHFLVKKGGKKNRTESMILPLTDEESAAEIARLLSGDKVSDPSLANARLLIQRARNRQPKPTKVRPTA